MSIGLIHVIPYNKKGESTVLPIETIVRLLGGLLLAFIAVAVIVVSCSRLYSSDDKYVESFEEFVEDVNAMSNPRDSFSIDIKKKSGIIGFSANGEGFECINCRGGDKIISKKVNIIFERPCALFFNI